jgi:hypothetical protein
MVAKSHIGTKPRDCPTFISRAFIGGGYKSYLLTSVFYLPHFLPHSLPHFLPHFKCNNQAEYTNFFSEHR